MIGVIIFSLLSGIGFVFTLGQSAIMLRILHGENDTSTLVKAMIILVFLFAFTLQGIAYAFAYASGY